MNGFLLVNLVLIAQSSSSAPAAGDGWFAPLVVPPGFEISVFADDAAAHSIHSLTFDALGRCVVSGPGYVRILEDRDGDGRCDFVKPFAEVGQAGLHGMLFVGRTLYGVDGRGVLRIPDADADDHADRIEPIGPRLTRGGEHGPHGIVLGPDGWLYATFGNMSGFNQAHVDSELSPVLEPAHGNIIRMTLAGERCEVVTTGTRNPYDLAFNAIGELFSVDSDNEAELGLPFYRYPRMFHAVPGIDIGWRDADHQWADYYPDTIGPVCDMGRGSPAGMVVYEHTRFPAKYRGALLTADWSWSRIVAFFPRRHGATWTATREDLVRTREDVTIETHGERDYAAGFYPTDLEVAPDGSVYIALGGRDTRGRVYRLRYTGALDRSDPTATDPVRSALALPQPSAAWSRAKRQAFRAKAGEQWVEELRRIARSSDGRTAIRVRAMRYLLAEGRADAVSLAFVRKIGAAQVPDLRAFAAVAVRLYGTSAWSDVLRKLFDDPDPWVRRRAIEAWPAGRSDDSTIALLTDHLGDPDRLCRHAAARALQHIDPAMWRAAAAEHPSPTVRLWAAMIDAWTESAAIPHDRFLALVDEVITNTHTPESRLEALRVLELWLDRKLLTVESLRKAGASMLRRLRDGYPTGDRRVNREIVNLLVRCGGTGTVDRLLARLESDDPAVERLHVVKMLSRMRHAWKGEAVRRLVRAWLRLDAPATGSGPRNDTDIRSHAFERNVYWPRFCRHTPDTIIDELFRHDYVGMLLAEPLKRLPDERFEAVWPALRERYVRLDPRARREVLTRLGIATVPETADFVRGQVDDRAVRLAAIKALCRFGRPVDHELFRLAVADDDVDVALAGVTALTELNGELRGETLFDLIGQLGRSPARPDRIPLRDGILDILTDRIDEPPARRRLETVRDEMQMVLDWQEWFVDTFPDFERGFPPLRDPARSWVDRRNIAGELLRRVDWSRGNVQAGREQFDRLGCIRCHLHSGQGEPFGPDLTGVGKRLSRRDLLEAVVLPSKSVPDQYAFTLLRFDDGRVLGGVVEREVGGTLHVRTTAGERVEVTAAKVVERVSQAMSPMPTGTLDPASDRDIADLFAYLTTGTPPLAAQPGAR